MQCSVKVEQVVYPGVLEVCSRSLCPKILPGGNYCYPHFADEKTEHREVRDLAQRYSAAK